MQNQSRACPPPFMALLSQPGGGLRRAPHPPKITRTSEPKAAIPLWPGGSTSVGSRSAALPEGSALGSPGCAARSDLADRAQRVATTHSLAYGASGPLAHPGKRAKQKPPCTGCSAGAASGSGGLRVEGRAPHLNPDRWSRGARLPPLAAAGDDGSRSAICSGFFPHLSNLPQPPPRPPPALQAPPSRARADPPSSPGARLRRRTLECGGGASPRQQQYSCVRKRGGKKRKEKSSPRKGRREV